MPLHPQARQFLDLVESMGLPTLPELPPSEGRIQASALNDVIGPGPDVAEVENFTITMSDGEQIDARRYEPKERPPRSSGSTAAGSSSATSTPTTRCAASSPCSPAAA